MKLKRINFKYQTKGFTLIEMLVSMVIVGIMLTLVMASYWTFLQTQQRMAVSRELQSEVRFAFNRYADKVRSSRVDYNQYSGIAGNNCQSLDLNGARALCLTDGASYYYFEHVDLNGDGTQNALLMGKATTSAQEAKTNAQPLISPLKFNVTNAHFAVSPAYDPKVDISQPQMQPKVKLYLEAHPTSERYLDLVIESQTTISSRQY